MLSLHARSTLRVVDKKKNSPILHSLAREAHVAPIESTNFYSLGAVLLVEIVLRSELLLQRPKDALAAAIAAAAPLVPVLLEGRVRVGVKSLERSGSHLGTPVEAYSK